MHTMPEPEAPAAQQSGSDEWEDGVEEIEFKPLTREEAQQWRAGQPELSI